MGGQQYLKSTSIYQHLKFLQNFFYFIFLANKCNISSQVNRILTNITKKVKLTAINEQGQLRDCIYILYNELLKSLMILAA